MIFLPSWWRWNPPTNENHLRGCLKDLNDLPASALIEAFAKNVEPLPEQFREAFLKGFREVFPNGIPNQDLDRNLGSEKQQDRERALRAAPPASARKEEATKEPDQRIVEIARRTLRDTPHAGMDYLINAVQDTARQQRRIEISHDEAIAALGMAGYTVN